MICVNLWPTPSKHVGFCFVGNTCKHRSKRMSAPLSPLKASIMAISNLKVRSSCNKSGRLLLNKLTNWSPVCQMSSSNIAFGERRHTLYSDRTAGSISQAISWGAPRRGSA